MTLFRRLAGSRSLRGHNVRQRRIVYVLLFIYIGVSLTYQIANSVFLIGGYFAGVTGPGAIYISRYGCDAAASAFNLDDFSQTTRIGAATRAITIMSAHVAGSGVAVGSSL